jgi:hypothetical protein
MLHPPEDVSTSDQRPARKVGDLDEKEVFSMLKEDGEETSGGLTPSEGNMLHQMWQRVKVDEAFYQGYEQWLEDEVWGYYD